MPMSAVQMLQLLGSCFSIKKLTLAEISFHHPLSNFLLQDKVSFSSKGNKISKAKTENVEN